MHPRSSSCTSSGSRVVRVHASSHRGFGGAAAMFSCCAPFFLFTLDGPSLPFSLEKKPAIANGVCGSCVGSRLDAVVVHSSRGNLLYSTAGYSYYLIAQRPLTCRYVSVCSLPRMILRSTWSDYSMWSGGGGGGGCELEYFRRRRFPDWND